MTRPEMTLDKQNIGDATRTSVKRDREKYCFSTSTGMLQVVPRPLFAQAPTKFGSRSQMRCALGVKIRSHSVTFLSMSARRLEVCVWGGNSILCSRFQYRLFCFLEFFDFRPFPSDSHDLHVYYRYCPPVSFGMYRNSRYMHWAAVT